jgi:hypothetical protein
MTARRSISYRLREKLAVARIVASYQREQSEHRLEVRLIRKPMGSTVPRAFAKKSCRMESKSSQAVGQFNAVLFTARWCEL